MTDAPARVSAQQEHLGAHRFARPAFGPCSVLLIGEDNPYSADPRYALWPDPPNAAGGRLARILGVGDVRHAATWRTNACDHGKWSMTAARDRARQLINRAAPWSVIIALGAKVSEAFRVCTTTGSTGPDWQPFEVRVAISDDSTRQGPTRLLRIAYLPHPSGRNARSWNAANRERARALVRDLAPDWYREGEGLES